MAEADKSAAGATPGRGRKPLLIGLALALAGCAGGFALASFGLLPVGAGGGAAMAERPAGSAEPVEAGAFVAIDPLVVSLGPDSASDHLRFAAELEVAPASVTAVESVMPRILDVLNLYLRAVDASVLEDPTALVRLRAQMLRRIRMVTGGTLVRDLLVNEFVLN